MHEKEKNAQLKPGKKGPEIKPCNNTTSSTSQSLVRLSLFNDEAKHYCTERWAAPCINLRITCLRYSKKFSAVRDSANFSPALFGTVQSFSLRCTEQCVLWLRAVLDNAFFDSALFWTMHSLTLRCSGQCVLWLCAVLDNAFFDSALFWTMRSLTPHCSGQCILWLCAVLDNALFDSAMFWTMYSLTLRCTEQCVLWFRAVLDNAFFDFGLYWTMNNAFFDSARGDTPAERQRPDI